MKLKNKIKRVFEYVYRPSSDSYYLLFTVLKDLMESEERNKVVVELGTGSGFIIGNLAR